jgi:hypothetical protein
MNPVQNGSFPKLSDFPMTKRGQMYPQTHIFLMKTANRVVRIFARTEDFRMMKIGTIQQSEYSRHLCGGVFFAKESLRKIKE